MRDRKTSSSLDRGFRRSAVRVGVTDRDRGSDSSEEALVPAFLRSGVGVGVMDFARRLSTDALLLSFLRSDVGVVDCARGLPTQALELSFLRSGVRIVDGIRDGDASVMLLERTVLWGIEITERVRARDRDRSGVGVGVVMGWGFFLSVGAEL
jgi:hypothetical protein